MVKDLTVQTQRVHLVVLEYFRSGVISEALDRSRSALGLSPHVVVADGLDGHAHVVGETDCLDGARILEAWYDEHDLRNWSWEQVGGSLFACLSDDRLVCKLGNNKISSVEPGVLVFRVGGSPRGCFNEFVTENNLESGGKDFEEPHFWIRVSELGCCGQFDLGGKASLEHVARVIQSFAGAVYKSAPVDGSNQKVFVTSFPAGDQTKPTYKDTGKENDRKKEHCIRWSRRAASADVRTNFLLGGPASVGSSDAFCQADTLSSSCCVQTEVIVLTFAIPFPTSPFQTLCWVTSPWCGSCSRS